ncbi:cystathionine beta-lyase [Bradyrhizobium sp. GM2.4]
MDSSPPSEQHAETRLVTSGRDTKAQKGFVNPPVFHGSTVLYPTAEDLHAHRGEFTYGRHGSPTTKAFQETLMTLEGPQCAGVGIVPSGLSAISTTLLSVLKAGDHILVCDNVYRPSRNFCNGMLTRYGVETTYFDPMIGAGIDKLFRPNTSAVLVEAPGSQSFEMPDIRAIAEVAHARGAILIDDNTWATPLYHRSLEQGVDISMQAATKYIGGHSDIMFGTISANARAWPQIAEGIRLLGVCAGPDDVFLALRGLRTLSVRLAQHHRSGLDMARWLCEPSRGRARAASGARDRSGSCDLEARLHRRFGPVQHRLEAGAAEGGRHHARYAQTVRHGLFLGRLRELGDSLRLRRLSHRHDMVAGRPDAASAYRARKRRRPQGRPRSRLRCPQGSNVSLLTRHHAVGTCRSRKR